MSQAAYNMYLAVGVVTVPEYGCISLNNEQKVLPVCQIVPWQELICHFTASKFLYMVLWDYVPRSSYFSA